MSHDHDPFGPATRTAQQWLHTVARQLDACSRQASSTRSLPRSRVRCASRSTPTTARSALETRLYTLFGAVLAARQVQHLLLANHP